MLDCDRLTIEEKVGQLFFLGFQGYNPDIETLELLDLIRPGGLVLSQRNIEGFDAVYELNTSLRDRFGVPLLVGINQEGGAADRLKHIFGALPSTSEAGSGGATLVRTVAKLIAAELESTGFNLDFAPALDLAAPSSIVGKQTFSSNPAEVIRLAGVFVEELAQKNILVCAKHFPGMGAATNDPHFVLPTIGRSRKHLLGEDVLPYLASLDLVGMMMVSHAHYPAFGDESGLPASLSPRIVNGLLRKKLGFDGVIITSDLTMGAITRRGLTADTFLEAFLAGNDMFLFSETTPMVAAAYRLIVRTVRANSAMRSRVDASVKRILNLKNRIVPAPLRYRTNIKARISRQIEKLKKPAEVLQREPETYFP